MAQTNLSDTFESKMFTVVLRAGSEYGSQPFLTAMVGAGTTSAEMTLEELEQMAVNEGKFLFKKGLVKNGLERSWEEIFTEYKGVTKDAWDRFVQKRENRGIVGDLPHPPLTIDHSPVTYYDFATIACQQNFFIKQETFQICQEYEEKFDGTANDVHDVIDDGAGRDVNVFGDDLSGVFSQAVAEAVGGYQEEVMEEEERDQDGREEIEDEIENALDEAAAADNVVKENPVFKRVVSQLEKTKKELKKLDKFNLEQGKQILVLEEQVKEFNQASAKNILSGLLPAIKEVLKDTKTKILEEVVKSNADVVKTVDLTKIEMNKSNEEMKNVVTHNMKTLVEVQKALMGGFGALIACSQEKKKHEQDGGNTVTGRGITPGGMMTPPATTYTPRGYSGPVVSRYNPVPTRGTSRSLQLQFSTPPGPSPLSSAEEALFSAQTAAQMAMGKLRPMGVPPPSYPLTPERLQGLRHRLLLRGR